MNRREFGQALAGGWPVPWACGVGRARAAPAERQEVATLKSPVEVRLPADKRVEVVEFFWYECPHCNALEPMLQAWRARLAPDVMFRCVPVGYTARHQAAQRLYFALEAMGAVERVHSRIFVELHERFRRIDSRWQRAALVRALGEDANRFEALFDAPAVESRVREANRLVEACDVEGVPTLLVQGRYRTSPEMTAGRERLFVVLDGLVERARALR